MINRHLTILVSILSLIGLSLFCYKFFILHFPLLPDMQTNTWDMEVRVSFEAKNAPVRLTMYLPQSDLRYSILDERFISDGFSLTTRKIDSNRIAVWKQHEVSGQQLVYYRATVRPTDQSLTPPIPHVPRLSRIHFTGAETLAAENVLKQVRPLKTDTDALVTALLENINPKPGVTPDENVKTLLGKKPTLYQRLHVVVQLLSLLDLPANVVYGYRLTGLTRDAAPVYWLEVYQAPAWRSYDVSTAERGIPEDYIAWQRNRSTPVRIEGARDLHSQLTIALNRETALRSAIWEDSKSRPLLYEFSLLGMPLDVAAVYHILLTVPIGVFLLIVLRNVIGVKTFGTFMPVLIALSFRETHLLLGVILFSLVVGSGLAVRFYLDKLKLLLAPRLAAILIVVIILMLTVSILSQKFGLPRGLSITLFPMVIMTMTIERMTIVWEERGAAEALQQGVGSLIVAALAYLVMNIHNLQHILFIFPELLLLVLACVLLLGRYTGYRLLELLRFRALTK